MEAPEKRGATYLMTGLLEEGAGEMDAQAFAEAREGWPPVSAWFLSRQRVDLSRDAEPEQR